MTAPTTAPRRSWNSFLWAGFGVTLLAFLSYEPVFMRWPATRDFPWVNLLLFVAGGLLLGIGLKRAYAQPARYRGKVTGVVLGVLSAALLALFCFFTLYFVRLLPSPNVAVQVGRRAPDFSLADTSGNMVTLSDLLRKNRAALLIFYRGYW